MKPVIVVGAGFSGLTLAHALNRLDIPVKVIESAAQPGGMISTLETEDGLVETAANALLANRDLEQLFRDLHLDFAAVQPERKRRYIFWHKPRRWPISLSTTFKLCWVYLTRPRPRAQESVRTWAHRVLNVQFEERLLTPGLQGIYAGDSKRMSASLILKRLFERGPRRGRRRGSVAPVQGMGQLIKNLTRDLQTRGVEFEFASEFKLPQTLEQPVVICVSAWQAEKIVRARDPELADQLRQCESLPLISVTAFYEPNDKQLRGFGCLFPESQGFQSLGVLINDCIFAGRSGKRSETWILGGAKHSDHINLSDVEVLSLIAKDRAHLTGQREPPLSTHITRWPRAIPHYTVEWEKVLSQLNVKRPLFLHGNYLGSLGLAQIHQRSRALAAQIKDLYVS